jgi:hypothetical protein
MLFRPKIYLHERIPMIQTKIEDKINEISTFYRANQNANYLNSIKQNISDEALKKYVDLYTELVIKVKDIHHRGCMNHLSPQTNVVLFYELCKVVKSAFNLFCVKDAEDIQSYLLQKKCNPNHRPFTAYEQKRMSEDKQKLTNEHISFISMEDIFIAILLHYCECKKKSHSAAIQYMVRYILPEIESELSIFLHLMISHSNMECQRGGKRSDVHKRSLKSDIHKRSLKKQTLKKRSLKKKKTRKH